MKTIIITVSGECENHFPEWLQEVTDLVNSGAGVALYANPDDERLETYLDGDGNDHLEIQSIKDLNTFEGFMNEAALKKKGIYYYTPKKKTPKKTGIYHNPA